MYNLLGKQKNIITSQLLRGEVILITNIVKTIILGTINSHFGNTIYTKLYKLKYIQQKLTNKSLQS